MVDMVFLVFIGFLYLPPALRVQLLRRVLRRFCKGRVGFWRRVLKRVLAMGFYSRKGVLRRCLGACLRGCAL